MQGNEAAVGFYWTMPVPWAGFTDVPKHVDAAAAVYDKATTERP